MAEIEPQATDLNLKSADDLLNRSDEELAKAFNFAAPKGETVNTDDPLTLDTDTGEPAADQLLEPKTPEAPAPETPATEAVEAAAAEKGAIPAEPVTDEPAKDEPPKPITEFKVFDKDGELEVPPDLTLTFSANGKVRESVPLDRVVRLAQRGVYNEEREQQALQAKQEIAQAQQEVAQLKDVTQQYEAWYAKLLSDEAFYQRAQDDYARQQSPEARAERAERQLAEERSRFQAENEAQQARTFVQTQLVPRVTQLLEENPSVSFDEMIGRYSLLTAPMLVRGQLPYSSLPMVQRLIDVDLAEWVRSKHASHEIDKRKVTNQVSAAQTRSQLAKRQLARATQPAPTTPATPKPKSWKTAEEWLDAALPVPQDTA